MADLTLSDGREVTFDLKKLSVTEYFAMFDSASEFKQDEAVLARVVGLTVEELHKMSLYDNKLIWRTFFEVAKAPLKDRDDPKA